MASIRVDRLEEGVPFGARVTGLTLEALDDEAVLARLRQVFEDCGVVVFRDVPISDELHLALSRVFGPIQHHALEEDATKPPGLLDLDQRDLSEVDGRRLCGVLPWHFDSAYVGKLNRAAVLRPVKIPPEGGATGFADGIQLYRAISPELRRRFDDLEIVYYAKLMFTHQRFGMPENLRWIALGDVQLQQIEKCEGAPRAVHPAVWTRESGERVLHVSPFQAAGIYGHEDAEGDALLESLCREIYAVMVPYWHRWEMTDLVLWDNWRCIHSVNGYDPSFRRHVQRYTIEGDYGLGFFEPTAESALE